MDRRDFLKVLGGGVVSVMMTGCVDAARHGGGGGSGGGRKPNFVVIFADDQGYQDMGCFGSPLIKTPNMDRMAKEGMRFTDFYSACSVCSPSRAALLTGCYPPRVGVTGVLFPRNNIGLSSDEVTIADVLKGEGYATACVGKWHLGHLKEFLPRQNGFDSYFGIPYSNDMTIDQKMTLAGDVVLREGMTAERISAEKPKKNWVPLMRNEEVVEYPADQTTLTKRYTAEAIGFIKSNKDKPFFLYFPHTMPHIPLFASEEFKGTSARGLYGDVIEEMDWSVGRILATLRSEGIDEDTLVVYTSDNGPWLSKKENGGCALPLRDGKFSTYEGGMREPTVMRWPGKIPAGKECSEVCGTIDLLPTLAKLAGGKTPNDRVIDGKDIWALMSGRKGAKSPHDAYYYYRGKTLEAVREGKWKLRIAGKKKQVELYDLEADIGEKNNVADSNRKIVSRLKAKMVQFDAELKANSRPVGKVTV